MSNKVGRFEILSELSQSSCGSIYKANDTESGQTVALKTLRLGDLGEQVSALVQQVLEECDRSKVLNSHNIALLYGAGEIGDLFCAALEYVQGNSIATMLARQEGFSIWDLQDIARQTCQGLDHAHGKGIVHRSLEPAKIMVTWDGTVKILGFGISGMSSWVARAEGEAPEILHYMSPEQLGGDKLDARSNLFSLGAILYEMVTEKKAFEGEDAEQVRAQIESHMPPAPKQVKANVNPVISDVVMRALAKNPDDRYQSGQELISDLERCRESTTKATPQQTAVKSAKATPHKSVPSGVMLPKESPSAANASPKASAPSIAHPTTQVGAAKTFPASAPAPASGARVSSSGISSDEGTRTAETSRPARAAAAAAGWNGGSIDLARTPKLDASSQFVTNCVKASIQAATEPQAKMSAAVAEPQMETPKIAIDPMMDERRMAERPTRSFSDIDELPPIQETYVEPPPPPPVEQVAEAPAEIQQTVFRPSPPPEKPKIQAREVAKKAVAEISQTPPKLFLYSIAAALGVILLVVVAIAIRIHNESADEDSHAVPAAASPSESNAAANLAPAPPATPTPVVTVAPVPAEQALAASTRPRRGARKKAHVQTPPPQPAIIPAQVTVTSVPSEAQVHIDGRTDPTWITPYNLTGLAPGEHSLTVIKPGFSPQTRTVTVTSGSKSLLAVQLAQLMATLSVTSEPAGAEVFLDGRSTRHVTPAQVSVDKPGNHSLSLKKAGYLDDSTTVNLQIGQTFHYSHALTILGNTEDIKTVSRFRKVFGGGGAATAGTGVVSIKTNPKGAQIAVNRRIIDKLSPVDFYLNPGTYIIDISLSGFKDVHRVIHVEKGDKVAIDETMVRE
jgi:eukaryotic-like serine/threonine-protein kinase